MDGLWKYFLMTGQEGRRVVCQLMVDVGGGPWKRRSICRRTNDPYGVGPTDCWLDAMAPLPAVFAQL